MDEFLAICQGIGLALAAGLGGALTLLFAAALASADLGWNLDGTDWSWVGDSPALAGFFVLNLATFATRNRPQLALPLAGAVSVGAGLLCGASFAEQGISPYIGLVVGTALAFGAARLAAGILRGAARRAAVAPARDEDVTDPNALVLFAAVAGLLVVVGSLWISPVAIPVGLTLAFLAFSRRRRAGEKYEGLRVLK